MILGEDYCIYPNEALSHLTSIYKIELLRPSLWFNYNDSGAVGKCDYLIAESVDSANDLFLLQLLSGELQIEVRN